MKNTITLTLHKVLVQRFLVGHMPSLGMTRATNSRPYAVIATKKVNFLIVRQIPIYQTAPRIEPFHK